MFCLHSFIGTHYMPIASPGIWSYRWLWVLSKEPGSSGKVVGVLNCGVISPAIFLYS